MVNESKPSVSFKTEFAVDMTCQSCVSAIRSALEPLPGIESYDIDLARKQVVVTGKAAPSAVCRALKDTGRQVLVRGSGTASGTHEGAAVAILETPLPEITTASATPAQLQESQQVHGIARMVQVSTSPVLMLMDLTVKFPGFPSTPTKASSSPSSSITQPPTYDVYVATTGDVTSPPTTTGPPHIPLTTLTPDPSTGYADAFIELPLGLWNIIGRAMVVEPSADVQRRIAEAQQRVDDAERRVREAEAVIGRRGRLGILAGVIARSAGAWGNEKTVCACSGKTMWEEGRMMEDKVRV
ncbi:hypothetical protein NliqN6_3515 [Naganishia liquefaciens]|uniref:Superoxide dismutase 1 copper chaperone n=1 Tax=Naganishia liquefaciens TaxID=104408 RepID=A0A8H3YFB2_9TREE|nr:hypothetical protein NliqN6_3515 [Naganishia liquefaciens]